MRLGRANFGARCPWTAALRRLKRGVDRKLACRGGCHHKIIVFEKNIDKFEKKKMAILCVGASPYDERKYLVP